MLLDLGNVKYISPLFSSADPEVETTSGSPETTSETAAASEDDLLNIKNNTDTLVTGVLCLVAITGVIAGLIVSKILGDNIRK